MVDAAAYYVYLLEQQSCAQTSRSDLKQLSLRHFEEHFPNKNNNYMGRPDPKM